jgi:serine/threonine protein phosphatase 1
MPASLPIAPQSVEQVMTRVLRFARNESGRDFVVGDIHGAFDLVLKAMAQADFNPEVDRIFSVGDLIDRGEGSSRCAKFLAQPYVHAVRGNHEDMLLDLYANGEPDPAVLKFMAGRNGFAWWLSVPEDKRLAILTAIRQLPLAIEIETARGTVGLIHADVPEGMSWGAFLSKIEADDAKAVEICLWGRNRIHSGNEDGVPGVGRIFVGHTPQWGGLNRYGNVYAIDTGAIFGEQGKEDGCLTMARMAMNTLPLIAQKRVSTLVDLRDDGIEPTVPFGYSQSVHNNAEIRASR